MSENFRKQLYGTDSQGVKVIKQGDNYKFEGTFDSMMIHGAVNFTKEELIDFLELGDDCDE